MARRRFLVGFFFLLQCIREKLMDLILSHGFGKRCHRAAGGNLIVFNPLQRSDQGSVEDGSPPDNPLGCGCSIPNARQLLPPLLRVCPTGERRTRT